MKKIIDDGSPMSSYEFKVLWILDTLEAQIMAIHEDQFELVKGMQSNLNRLREILHEESF